MTLNLQNVDDAKKKLDACEVGAFLDVGQSFKCFVTRARIDRFRRIQNLEISFRHPISVIAGTNTIGKTSLLIILACSHENFLKFDSTSPSIGVREHAWNDMLTFTNHESTGEDYSYHLDWRVVAKSNTGNGKRIASSKSWSGLGKKSADSNRTNAKIKNREVRLIDLERILPGRSFSNALFRKSNQAIPQRLAGEVEQAFSYIFDCGNVKLYEVASHINKTCYLIEKADARYSSFNAASGEEAVIYLLKDIIESPKDSLILIDEVEAGFHPAVQRKIADVVQYISWRDKKQFVITTHSPTFLSSFSKQSRLFIELRDGAYSIIEKIPPQVARSKMDAVGHPLLRLYCEDDLAEFLITKVIIDPASGLGDAIRVINIIRSGPADQVNIDYTRHKRNFSQYRNKVGCCAILDGDYVGDPKYSSYVDNPDEFVGFIYPHTPPEKFLVKAYLLSNPNSALESALVHEDHHSLFNKMVALGLAADKNDARNVCFKEFRASAEYSKFKEDISMVVSGALEHYSQGE